MSQIYLFSATSQLANWLSVRQSAVAENIANANTPGYRAADIPAFAEVMDETRLRLAASQPGHFGYDPAGNASAAAPAEWNVARSDKPVSVEDELIKADEVNRSYALHTGVMKAFHRMLLLSVKG
jgi:flagellar basal-body rod protein FlgB